MCRTYLVFGIVTARTAMGTLPPASLAEPVCVQPPHVSHPNNAYGYSIHDSDLYSWCKYALTLSNLEEAKAKVKIVHSTRISKGLHPTTF